MTEPSDDDICPECGLLVIDHTLRLFREHHATTALQLPYEPVPDGPIEATVAVESLASAVTVRGLAAQMPRGMGIPPALPALGFTFYGPDGVTVLWEGTLVLDDTQMRAFRMLVGTGIDSARKAARRFR